MQIHVESKLSSLLGASDEYMEECGVATLCFESYFRCTYFELKDFQKKKRGGNVCENSSLACFIFGNECKTTYSFSLKIPVEVSVCKIWLMYIGYLRMKITGISLMEMFY